MSTFFLRVNGFKALLRISGLLETFTINYDVESPFKQEFDIYKSQTKVYYSSNVNCKQLSVVQTIDLV